MSSGSPILRCLQTSFSPPWCSPWRSWSAWSKSALSSHSMSPPSSRSWSWSTLNVTQQVSTNWWKWRSLRPKAFQVCPAQLSFSNSIITKFFFHLIWLSACNICASLDRSKNLTFSGLTTTFLSDLLGSPCMMSSIAYFFCASIFFSLLDIVV